MDGGNIVTSVLQSFDSSLLNNNLAQIFNFINVVDTVNLPMLGDSNAYVPSVSPMKKGCPISKAAAHFLLKPTPICFQILCSTTYCILFTLHQHRL